MPETHYRYLGSTHWFEDELVVIGEAFAQRVQWLVDLCIAKAVAQGTLESYLLEEAIGREQSLQAAVSNCPVAYRYLSDWDAKYGTDYHPELSSPQTTPPLTIEDQGRLDDLDRLVDESRREGQAGGDLRAKKYPWFGRLGLRFPRWRT